MRYQENQENQENREYRFSFGDTVNGPIGGVIVVRSDSAENALRLAQTAAAFVEDGVDVYEHTGDIVGDPAGSMADRLVDFRVYFNADRLTLSDLETVDDFVFFARSRDLANSYKRIGPIMTPPTRWNAAPPVYDGKGPGEAG